ncbi:MAG: Uma2 family endonuclease [Prevotellaceae bacterium]|jgi:Uma2 family endonuclease|nr:Uma2 family endonuclease [Prevotellaceae bacterium]
MELSLDLTKRYTYADYYTWWDNTRRELVHGLIRLLPPSHSPQHQTTVGSLGCELYSLMEEHKIDYAAFMAPLDVRLPKNGEKEDDRIDTVVQPDVCIICDPSKIDDRGCLGAPDFIAEVQSPSTAKYDLSEKFALYEASGVREYWVVFPAVGVQVFLLQPNGKYDEGTTYEAGKIPVHIFDGLEIDLEEIIKY